MLANDNLKNMGHNSSSYIHLISEALNLAFSDREHYFSDPDFVDVPISTLLSSAYTQTRRAQIDPAKAFGEMPPPGKTEIEPHYPAPSLYAEQPNSGQRPTPAIPVPSIDGATRFQQRPVIRTHLTRLFPNLVSVSHAGGIKAGSTLLTLQV